MITIVRFEKIVAAVVVTLLATLVGTALFGSLVGCDTVHDSPRPAQEKETK